jgi:hypothetical protein
MWNENLGGFSKVFRSVLGSENGENWEMFWWGPHLNKVLFAGSSKENLFDKIFEVFLKNKKLINKIKK